MPRYYLHVNIANRRVEDPEGVHVADLDALKVELEKAADELRAEGLLDRELTEADHYEIADDMGDVIGTVSLNDALRL